MKLLKRLSLLLMFFTFGYVGLLPQFHLAHAGQSPLLLYQANPSEHGWTRGTISICVIYSKLV